MINIGAFLLKNWKGTLIVILIIAVISGIGTINVLIKKYQEEKADKEGIMKLNEIQAGTIVEYRNQNNRLVSRAEVAEIRGKTIAEMMQTGQLKWLKELEGLKKNMKNLEYAYNIQSSASDSLRLKLDKVSSVFINSTGDTVIFQGVKFKFNDKYARITAEQISPDSIDIGYHIDVPISGALFWKRKFWIFSKKKYYAEVTSENPNVIIPKVISLRTRKKK